MGGGVLAFSEGTLPDEELVIEGEETVEDVLSPFR